MLQKDSIPLQISFDTPENEPSKVCYKDLIRYKTTWIAYSQPSEESRYKTYDGSALVSAASCAATYPDGLKFLGWLVRDPPNPPG